MAADDVASALARVAAGPPENRIVEVAGPDQFPLDKLIRDVLARRNDPREVITDSQAGYFGITPGERTLLPSEGARLGTMRFDDWFKNSPGEALRHHSSPVTEASDA